MPPLSIMIKPASSLCNMRCRYCFYHDVAGQRDIQFFGVMNEETAENLITKALQFANGESVAFAFQGGEPLIAGLDYFRNFVSLVKKHNHLSSQIYFSLQTNGTLVTAEWAEFFKENGFLIGLSLDGDFQTIVSVWTIRGRILFIKFWARHSFFRIRALNSTSLPCSRETVPTTLMRFTDFSAQKASGICSLFLAFARLVTRAKVNFI